MDRSLQEWLQYTTDSCMSVPVTPCSAATLSAALCVLCPWSTIDALLYRVYRLVFGTLYPAYASYKAVRTKNVKEYVKWMMYWIVFALFTSAETFTDVFLSFWFPFYYEIKIILVLWLLSPATKGSSILYRKFVHPMLSRREQDIDECIAKAKEQGYHTVVQLGTKGMNYATTVLMQTAIKTISAPSFPLSEESLRSRTSSEPSEPDMAAITRKRRSRSLDEADNVPLRDSSSEEEWQVPAYLPEPKKSTRENRRSARNKKPAKKSKSSTSQSDELWASDQ